ncbi:MAG: DUF3313 domain-containing protein [Nitrospirae bacterium]|nr:DUF3313 domain-containing protein [Nitrospirota bacterium]
MTKKAMPYLLAITMVFLLLSGCASTNGKATESEGTKYTGFLSDYAQLKPEGEGSKAMKYVNPQADLKKYKKVLIEKIIVWLKDDAAYKGIDPDAFKAMTDYFHEALVRELGTDYPVVTEPGPDVLRVRIAITDLVPTKTAVTVLVLVTPYATVADLASGAASKGGAGSAPYLGNAGIEAEGIDSETLQPVFSYVDMRYGKKYDAENPGAYFKAYTEWGYVKGAFDFWAKKFRTRLDEVNGKKVEEKK